MSLNGCLLHRETGNPKSGASYRLKQVGRGPGGALVFVLLEHQLPLKERIDRSTAGQPRPS